MSHILVAGGAGFIGSHTVLALKAAGYDPLVFDNLSNGHTDAVHGVPLVQGDIRHREDLDRLFGTYDIKAIIHFAASIEAGESVKHPLDFYDNNVGGSLQLIRAAILHGVKHMIFSSTAAVYGMPHGAGAIREDAPKVPINPYGQTKLTVENILQDTATAHAMKAIVLRYFNAAGADPAGRLGERHDPETHLIPLIIDAACGLRENIKIFGTDYPTPDGTCIRDYIHVADLADAHVKALTYLLEQSDTQTDAETGFFEAFNLGNGAGYSVREVIDCVKRVSNTDFPVLEEDRRPGDPPRLVASSHKAHALLGWQPTYPNIEDMVRHAFDFAQKTSHRNAHKNTH